MKLGIEGKAVKAKEAPKKEVIVKQVKQIKKEVKKQVKKEVKTDKKQQKKQNKKSAKVNEKVQAKTEGRLQIKKEQKTQPQVKQEQQIKQVNVQQRVKKEPILRPILIRYNHYNTKFQSVDDFVSWKQIDQQYSISYVFKGNYIPILRQPKSSVNVERVGEGWLLPENEYVLSVLEDEEEEAKYEKKAYVAPKPQPKRGSRHDDLTEQLKGLSLEQLREKGDKYRELIECRELQDILYK